MKKKFLKVTLLMTIIFSLFLMSFKSLTGKVLTKGDSSNELVNMNQAILKYEGFEENENMTIIKVSMKNNTDFYASINNVYITFHSSSYKINNEGWERNLPSPEFKGMDSLWRKEDYSSYYINPGETKIYEFEIAKGINFDKDYFNTNEFSFSADIQYYKYKLNDNMVAKLVSNRSGGLGSLSNEKDPYVID